MSREILLTWEKESLKVNGTDKSLNIKIIDLPANLERVMKIALKSSGSGDI